MELKNKIVLLSGASTGIGKAIARSLLKRKAKVVVFGQHKPAFSTKFYKVDIGDESQVVSAMSGIKRIDILINNAGSVADAEITGTSNKMLDDMLNVNFKSVFWMSKHSIPKLSRGGCIINISSLLGLRSFPGSGVYAAAKAAVISLTETLAQELAGRSVSAGWILLFPPAPCRRRGRSASAREPCQLLRVRWR